MAETNIHTNGSFVGDSIDEFKKLPMWGKIAAVGVLVIVAYLAYRARASAGTSAQSAAAGTAGTPSSGSQSPFPMVGSVPLLPSNVNPLYDTSGGLVGYQNNPTSGASGLSGPQAGTPGKDYGLIPFGQYQGPSYSNLKPNTSYTYNGTKYLLSTGPQGKLYGSANGSQVLLYQPASFYPGGSNYKASGGTGSGPGASTSEMMANPNLYLQSAEPHVPSSVPQ